MRHYSPDRLPKLHSEAVLEAIRGMPCTLRISSFVAGHRCSHVDTVVPCHIQTIGKGMSTKVSDIFVAAGCHHCHELLDGRDKRWHFLMENYPAAVMDRVLRGMCETQMMLVHKGVITVKSAEIIFLGEYM